MVDSICWKQRPDEVTIFGGCCSFTMIVIGTGKGATAHACAERGRSALAASTVKTGRWSDMSTTIMTITKNITLHIIHVG